MRRKWKIMLIAFVVIVVSAINLKVILNEKQSEKLFFTSLTAISEGGITDNRPVYRREEGSCTITGKGRIEVFGKGFLEVNGHITIDGKVACYSGGEALCSTVDCKDLYMWTD